MKENQDGPLAVNDLVRRQDENGGGRSERVLWLNRYDDIVFLIDIDAADGFPEIRQLSLLEKQLKLGLTVRLTNDPYNRTVDEQSLSDKSIDLLETAWRIISGLASPEQEPDIYFRNRRGPLVKKAAADYGVTVKTVYKYLRKYWQRGKNKEALLPDYENSGGRGRLKRAGAKKRGRPRKNAGADGTGINIDQKVRAIIAAAGASGDQGPDQGSIRQAYFRMLEQYYPRQVTIRPQDGIPVPRPGARVPTYVQFRYWHKRMTDQADSEKLSGDPGPKTGRSLGKAAETKAGSKPGGRSTRSSGSSPLRQPLPPPRPEEEIAATAETGAGPEGLDACVIKGFEAKIQGRLEETLTHFRAAVKLNPPLDLQVLLVLDLAAVLKELGRYREAAEVLAGFEREKAENLTPEVLLELRSNLKYLQILQELLDRTNTPAMPFSKIPTIIKAGVQRKLNE